MDRAEAGMEMEADIRLLPTAVDFAREFFESFPDIARDPMVLYELQVAVSEALTNVMKHAYPGRTGPVALTLSREGDTAVVTVTDRGAPFDARAVPEPDLEAPSGRGLGIFLLRRLMDTVEYSRSGPVNTLTLSRKVRP